MKTKHLLTRVLVYAFALLSGVAFAAPATLVQSVTYNGETITMRLNLQNLRGANFALWAHNAAGTYDVITPVAERSYIGTVDEYPDAVSCGILQDDGTFRGAVFFDRGVSWRTLGNAVEGTQALDYAPDQFTAYSLPSAPTVSAGQAGATTYGFDLGIDAEYTYFSTPGNSSVAKTFELIEYNICLVRAQYMRDALLRPYLGRVIIRTDQTQDPYNGLGGGAYLDAVRADWNANHTDANSDLVAGVSVWSVGGGLAWVGVVGTNVGYSVNDSGSSGSFDIVFRHEMGHNWNCGHFVGGSPEGKGFMGGNGTGRMSGCEVYRVLGHRDAKVAAGGILDSEGTYSSVELPPYASMDVASFVQTVDAGKTISVLANDHDANGQTLSIVSFDSVSAKGGTITQQGNDLVYTAHGAHVGTDYFKYVIQDTTGKTATGVVVVDVRTNDDLKLYLALDETTGTIAANYAAQSNDATLWESDFATATVAGQYGNAVELDGINDHLTVSGISLDSNTVTMTAWIKPNGTPTGWAGLIFDRSHSGNGLNFGNSGELRYHWNDSNWGWNSGLVPTPGTWTFVALVIESNRATIYMNDGTGFQTAVNTVAHNPGAFGTTYIGRDPANSSRHFKGTMDEARLYGKAMTQAELQQVYDGGAAESPSPFDGASQIVSQTLRWSSGADSTSNQVYVGTSAAAVAAATTASPEYQGSTTSSTFKASLSDSTTYFWRVDTVTSSATYTGTVWSFTTGTVKIGTSIAINFKENNNQNFAGGQLIGPTSLNSSGWNAVLGASGTQSSLIDDAGDATGASLQWSSKNTWYNSDGTGDDQHKLSTGYLDDGTGVNVTISNIPYANYKVYGLIGSDQNGGGSAGTVNFNVNGNWALGGNASTTAATWGTINSNQSANGSYWTEIVSGSVQGNYWIVDTSGSTCTIAGELKNGTNRGSLAAVIIEEIAAVNAAPVADDATFSVAENASAGTSVGTVVASDPNAGDTLSYAITAGNGGGEFAIDVNNGAITTTTALNYEASSQYVLTVTVTDDGNPVLTDTATITVNVTDVNEAPVFTVDPISTANATEAVAYSDTIAGSATDIDAGDTLSYSKLSGPAWLTVATDGSLSGTPSNGDVGPNAFTVQADDGNGGTDTATLNITVDAASGTIYTDDFERSAGSTIGNGWIEQTNDSRIYDTAQPATKMLISVTAGTPFAVVNQLTNTFVAGERYELVWNGSRAAAANGTLIYDVSIGTWDGTTFTPLATEAGSIANVNLFGKTAGPSVYFTASGAEAGQPIAVRFEVVTGSSDWAGFDDISVNALGANTAPTFAADPFNKADATEDAAYSATISADASDADVGDTLSYSKLTGPSWLSIAADGSLSGTPANNDVGLNAFTVRVTDAGGLSADATMNITVINTNDAPVANDNSGSIAEDATIGTAVVTVSATDVDAGDTLSYAITAGNTGGAFAIDSSGNITTATALDYETTAQYVLTVTVTDDGTPALNDTATVTVDVTDVVETTAPVVATGAASGITKTEANIAYTISDDGGEAPTVTLYYGLTDGGTVAGNWDSSSALGSQSAGSYSTALNGLTEGTTYYFTIHASNSAGAAWGSTGSFTTEADTSPKLVRTTVSSVSSTSWTSVDLGQSYNSAVIIATPIYPNSTIAPVVTRIRNVSGSSFEVKIDRADGLTAAVSVDVSIVAVEEGVYTQATDGVTMEAVKYTSTVTAENNNWTAEARTYQNSYTTPVVVGQVMSANDANWSTFWCRGSSRTSPPSASSISVGKHVGEDPNTTRANETIGYIVIESGNGTLNGVAYSARLGTDSVRGTGNTSSGFTYSLSGLATTSAAAVSLAGLDGADGGWAVLYGATPLVPSQITLAVDEDQLGNSERKHTTEQLGYIVFE